MHQWVERGKRKSYPGTTTVDDEPRSETDVKPLTSVINYTSYIDENLGSDTK